MTAQGYEEKRDFARMRIDTVVTYNIKGSSNQAYQGTSQNLSATGLYMTTDNIIDIGTEIELSINASNQLLPPLKLMVALFGVLQMT